MLKLIFRVAVMCAWGVSMPLAQAAEATSDTALPPPFLTYQNWRDEPLQDWREVNDRVGAIGGWRTYLRDAQETGGAAGGESNHHAGH